MSVEDRVSTAARATAASVRHIRPLQLPDEREVPARRRARRGRPRFRGTWLIPLSAAAAVIALVLVQLTLRPGTMPRLGPVNSGTAAPSVAGVPRYFAFAFEGNASHAGNIAITVTIGDTRTGKTVASASLPAIGAVQGGSVVGVSAAGDDRTFVVGRRDVDGDTDFFQVRLTLGAKPAAVVKRLPVPQTKYGDLLGWAVSPDGQELAALSLRGNGTTLRIYSVTTGATLRTWTAGTWRTEAYGYLTPSVSWTADSRQVAFTTSTGQDASDSALTERVISVARPDGDLAAASRVIFYAPSSCSTVLLAPDGGSIVCGTRSADGGLVSDCQPTEALFTVYSVATGKPLRTLYEYQGACDWVNSVQWTDHAGQHVAGVIQVAPQGQPLNSFVRFGVIAQGTFAPVPFPKLGHWWSGPAF